MLFTLKRGFEASSPSTLKNTPRSVLLLIVTSIPFLSSLSTLAEDLTNVNAIANDMVRGSMLNTFAINHNYGTFEIENGLNINTSYTLYDRDTVANLIKNDPDILKRPSLDKNLDKRWNKIK